MAGTEPLVPIDVRGDLHLDAPSGRVVRLLAVGSGLRLDVPGWGDLKALGPQSFAGRRHAIISTARRLAMLGLSLDIKVHGRPLLRLGGGVTPNLLSRALGLGSVYLPVSALLTAWLK